MTFEFQHLDTDKKLQHYQDESCITDFYKSDNFEAHFYNSENDEYLTIKGWYELDFEEEDTSFTHHFGTEKQSYFYIDKVTFYDIEVYLNDSKIHMQDNNLQTLLNDVENEIINAYEN